MRNIAIILALLFFLPSVHAIALGYPNIGDIMFEPEKQVNLEYVIQNGAPKDLPVKVTLGVGAELSDFVNISPHVTKVPGNGSQKIYVTILFPDEMEYGIFPITLTVVEDSPVAGAFIAHVGASHTVKVINAHPTGTPVLEYRGQKIIGASGTSNIDVSVRNIGRTDIAEKKVFIKLIHGNITAEGYSERITVPPLEEQIIKVPFKVDVPPGMYTMQIGMTGSKETINTTVQVGQPTVKVNKIQKFSNENLVINVDVTNEWLEPLTEATVALLVYAPNTSRKVLFESSATSLVLQPGKNSLTLKILKPRYIDNGVYPAALQVLSPPYYIGADGEFQVELTEVGKMLQQQAQKDPAWEYENVSIDAPRLEAVAKNKKLMILILVVAIAMFLFSLAMIMKRKKKEEPEQKTGEAKDNAQKTPPIQK